MEGIILDLTEVIMPLFNDRMNLMINPTVCFLNTSLCGMSSSHILKIRAQDVTYNEDSNNKIVNEETDNSLCIF